jgi:hypothetical protein
MTIRVCALLAALTLAACSGSSPKSALPKTVANAPTSITATLTIPNAKTYPMAHRSAQYISSSTNSVTFTIDNGTPQTFNAAALASDCTVVAAGRLCTFTFAVSNLSGNVPVNVQTFDAASNLLSEATVMVTIVPGTTVTLPMVLDGVAASASFALSGTFTFGQSATLPIVVTVSDPDGNVIVGNAPFDNNAYVQFTLPNAVPAQFALSPATGNPTTATSATITSPGDAVVLSYGGGATLGVRVTGSFVNGSSHPLGTKAIAVSVPAGTNALDYHTSFSPSSTRATRGPDGDVYVVGTGSGTPAIGRVHFAGGTAAVEYCTISGSAADVAVSASNEVVYAIGSSVYTFSANAFPHDAPCGATLSSYALPANAASIAADASGVYVAYQFGFSDPTYGTAVNLATYSAGGVYNGGPDTNPNGSIISPVLTGDPSGAYATEYYSDNYGYNVGAAEFTTTSSFSTINTGAAGDVYANDGYRFAADPYSSALYLMDTTQSNSTFGTMPPPALYTVSGGGVSALGPSLPSSVTVAVPAATPFGAPAIITPQTIYQYDAASGQFATIPLTAPAAVGTLNLVNGTLGNDGRLWLIDASGHLLSYPGTGQTGA